jgi:tRNA-2-methylthio-N6-dimethylallyladenosine synthase
VLLNAKLLAKVSTPMTSKLFIKTFGCQMNEYDSNKMIDVLNASEGSEVTQTVGEADIVIFNTCSVREKAQEKVFSDLGRIRELKLENPNLIIAVGGCVASQEGAAIVKRAPYVDLVFGPQTLHRLPQMIAKRRATGRPQVDISFPEIEKFDALPPPKIDGPTAFVSIMEGCSKYCSFCVVPYTRGEEVSRPVEDVLTEIAVLANKGVTEVTLLGQNVNAYQGKLPGLDDPLDFAGLLELVNDVPGIERIRFTTSHPKEFTQRLIDAYAKLPKLVDHLHLPVQAGSDRVLMAMKRGYTALEFKSIIRKLKQVRPNLTLTSDFIVGFPGETDSDFEKTIDLIEELGFDNSFSFIYSMRPGTPAASLVDDTPQATKLARLQRLQQVITTQMRQLSESMIGKTEAVLIEGLAKKSATEIAGRTSNNRVVNINLPPSRRVQDLVGKIVDVRITESMSHSLRGELVALSD